VIYQRGTERLVGAFFGALIVLGIVWWIGSTIVWWFT
jgi:uncharacterized membrane protein YccC